MNKLTITATGGSGNYEYSIDGGSNWQDSPVFENIVAGTYTPLIRDKDTSETIGTTDARVFAFLKVESLSFTHITKFGLDDGTITLQAAGGSGGYEYSLNGEDWFRWADDWFLPSENELIAMYDNLHAHGVGGFITTSYWSSTEASGSTGEAYARRVQFTDGLPGTVEKHNVYRVRAARSFALTEASPSYILRDQTLSGGWIFLVIDNEDGSFTYYEAAAIDQGASQAWSNITNAETGAKGNSIGLGKAHTEAIIAQVGHTASAAKICNDYIVYGDDGGWVFTDLAPGEYNPLAKDSEDNEAGCATVILTEPPESIFYDGKITASVEPHAISAEVTLEHELGISIECKTT